MKFFISIFKFTGLVGIMGYVILYNLDLRFGDNLLLFTGIGSFVAILALKFYWFYQLNYLRDMKTTDTRNNKEAVN